MIASRIEEPMPPTPIQLKWCITETSRVDTILERVVNSHYRNCPRRQEGGGECSDALCRYFTWHLNHHTAHRQIAQDCQHCTQFESWIEKHSTIYCRSSCGLTLCREIKKRSVKSRFHSSVTGFNDYMCQKSPSSSLNQGSNVPRSPAPSIGEVTGQTCTIDDINDGYCSGTTSSTSSPSCTQYLESLPDPEAPLPITSHVRKIAQLFRQPSELMNDLTMFHHTESHERNSISHENLLYSVGKRSGSDVSQGENDSEKGESVFGVRNGSLDHSLPYMPPQPASTSLHTDTQHNWSESNSSHSQFSAYPHRRPLTFMKNHPRDCHHSDSAFGSTSENEDMSSIESETLECTPTVTLESVSTPSTIPAAPSIGSSTHTMSPMDPLSKSTITDLPCYLEEQCQLTDNLLDVYGDEITVLQNRGRPILVDNPLSPEKVASTNVVHIDHDWRESYAMPSQRRRSPTLTHLYEQYMPDTPNSSFPEEDVTIERELDHRASVRKYLQGQFYLQQTYCEHVHWKRVRQIGNGGQAKCYCIEDNANKYPLCLKEETENEKTLDEAFICLKLAMLVRDAPQNIVEFFGASILPYYNGNNYLQLFLELMPGCLQGYVFDNGPLCPDTTLNYSYQLFEALDYLHQRLKVIHCDIKPANLLIDYNCQRLKVADFGCAELLEECCHGKGFPKNNDAGTLWYNPPEFYCTGNCSFGMDIWQAGCSVLFMITGRRPWRHLCMDVNKQNPRANASRTKLMKKQYCELLGKQGGSYPLPGFLTSGVRQLLLGCLQSTGRLSAKDCVYLAAVSETTNSDQESKLVEKLGYIPTHDVLDRLQTSMYNTERVVDVYLGKEGFSTYLDGMPYAMLNGWLGSVPYQSGMTYGDLKELVRQQLPVTQHFGDFGLAISDNDPQAIWKAVGTTRPYRVRPDQRVEPTRALVLLPKEITYV